MKHNAFRSLRLTSVVVTVLVLSALMTLPVLADGGETPPPPTATPTEVTPPPTETATPVPTEEIATPTTVDPVVTDTPVAESTEVVPTDTPVVDLSVPTEVPTSSDNNVLSDVPSDTQVVVTDANGNALPLASADAAEAIASSDPIWCPSGVLVPVGGGAGCSPAMTSMTDLITWLTANNPGAAGTIWIAKDYNSSTAVGDGAATGFTLDGLVLTNMANYALTVKGGWNGLGTGSVDTTSPSTFDGDSFSIINWKGDVTLNDLLITNVPGAGSTALTVKTTKKVTTNRVKVQTNVGAGAKIDNTASGTGTGDVQITLSQFLNNAGGMGLEVHSRGAITLSGVLANSNGSGGDGANLDNSTAPVAKNVIINTGVNVFSNNAHDGLYIYSKGAVILKSITANYNGQDGIEMNNRAGSAQPVTITGTNVFVGNVCDGLRVFSLGAISVSNVTASDQSICGWGAVLDNASASTAQPVSVLGTNVFNNNVGGLYINSRGAITTNNITAQNNSGNYSAKGVYLQNNYNFASNMTMTGVNVIANTGFNANGLMVLSNGSITLNNVTSSGNGGVGAYLDNSTAPSAKNVTVNGTNSFSTNTGSGLMIFSRGTVILAGATVNGNSGAGTKIDNVISGTGIGNVTVTLSKFLNNAGGTGLEVNSRGSITLSGVVADNNGGDGANLDNSAAPFAKMVIINTGVNEFNKNTGYGLSINSKGAVILKDITANTNNFSGTRIDNSSAVAQPVTLSGINIFSENKGSGLEVYSAGAITANSLIANVNSGGWGAILDNISAAIAQPVKLTGNNEFKVTQFGLYINSNGAITTNNVTATNTLGGRGVVLKNDYGFTSNVTMTGVNLLTDNYDSGLSIYSMGVITLYNVTANNNGIGINAEYHYGAQLDNSSASGPMAVDLYGTNTFNNNYSNGLEIHSKGTVLLSKITASNNSHGMGMLIKNDYGNPLASQNVTLSTANTFNGNYASGLEIYSYGAITIANLTANGNGIGGTGNGAKLDNHGGTLPKAVTLTGTNQFNKNIGHGLWVISTGAITLNNVTANNNINLAKTAGGNGVFLDNTASTTSFPQNITLAGKNEFNGNYVSGLNLNTYGVVLISNLTANDNSTGYGALIHNELATLPKVVTLTGYGFFNNNKQGGLYITSKGAITLNNVTANNNIAGNGANLDNKGGTANVTINGTNTFSGNNGDGLYVVSLGAILTNNLTVNDNKGLYGVYMQNWWFSITLKPVTLNGINVFNNNGAGLSIYSTGTITISKVDASNNSSNGISLSNGAGANVPGNVNIIGWSYTDNNKGAGMVVFTDGNITIANLNINKGSYDAGVYLVTHGGNVTFSGASQIFNCTRWGLRITTEGGSVTLNNLTVSGNGFDGVYIDTTLDGTPVPQAGVQNVTLTGFNTFWDNGGRGLYIRTYGAIAISNIDAYNNRSAGVYLNGCGVVCGPALPAPKGITITGSNFFEKNGDDGLYAVSYGAITISNIHSTNNGWNGAQLYNHWGAGSVGGITVAGVNSFEGNGYSGLVAFSNGAIITNNLTADANKKDGVLLDNKGGATAVVVTLNGVNSFANNGTTGAGSGLVVTTGGQITANNVTAIGNQGSGASLDNFTNTNSAVVKPGVKLTGVNVFSNNVSGNGLYIHSYGTVGLMSVAADVNGMDGLNVVTSGPINVTCSSMNGNAGNGWDLTSVLITLKGVFGYGNTGGNITSSTPVVSRVCPLSIPVVVKPVDDSDSKPHGSRRSAPVYQTIEQLLDRNKTY